MSDELNGIFLVNKELGRSSFSIVREIKKRLNLKKVGHAGTLDPLASGLLIIMVGKFTKRFDDFQNLDKEYEAEIVFGKETDTYDSEGKVIHAYQGKVILSEDKIKKSPPPKRPTGEQKDKRPKIRGSIFKRQPPLPRR